MTIEYSVILSTKPVSEFPSKIAANGFDVIELDITEFAKSGRGAKCLAIEAYPGKAFIASYLLSFKHPAGNQRPVRSLTI